MPASTFIRECWHKVAKLHERNCCGHTIQKGQRYLELVGKSPETQYQFVAAKYCAQCADPPER